MQPIPDMPTPASGSADETLPVRCKLCDAPLPPLSLLCTVCGHDQSLPPLMPGEGTRAGDVVGVYRLIKPLGKGGFGVVWLAEQTDPVKREVALKLIKPGMDSEEIIKRFEAEYQRLAAMEHPNIATVLSAGTTPAGRPYFVMPVVKGVPITEYCDAKKLGIRQRLELFMRVCLAVQHAHQKAVLHRDLKPSNILVEEVDGQPVPKIIDFGVAKALDTTSEHSLGLTHEGAVIGTLTYMSPEQAGKEKDVDARSDIYALGVILYEMLTGQTPFTSEHLLSEAREEALRIIREEDPPKPSQRVKSTTHETATMRQTETSRLTRCLAGDLDWIVLMALEKQRERRYASANELALDVERHLNNEPVSAAAPTLSYRVCKFAVKHRAAMFTAALSCIALLLLAISLVSHLGEAKAIAKAQELDEDLERKRGELDVRGRELSQAQVTAQELSVDLERKRVELALRGNALSYSQAQAQLERGSPRRAMAWLTQALREHPSDQASLDVLMAMIAEREWLLPLEYVPFSAEMMRTDPKFGECGKIQAYIEADGSLQAQTVDWTGVVGRAFRFQDGVWQPPFYESPVLFKASELPSSAAEKAHARKHANIYKLSFDDASPWMLRLSKKSEGDQPLNEGQPVYRSKSLRWALALEQMEVASSLGYEAKALFNLEKQSIIPISWSYPTYPIFDELRDWVWLLDVEQPLLRMVNLTDPKEDTMWEGPDVSLGEIRDYSARTTSLTEARLAADALSLLASYEQAIETRETLLVWKLNRDDIKAPMQTLGGLGAYLPLPVRDVASPTRDGRPGRVLMGDDKGLFLCRHTGWQQSTHKGTEFIPKMLVIDYGPEERAETDTLAKHQASGMTLSADADDGHMVVKDRIGARICGFQVQNVPGEGGWDYRHFAFTENGEWVIAIGFSVGGGSYQTDIYEARSGRKLYGPIENCLYSLAADGSVGHFTGSFGNDGSKGIGASLDKRILRVLRGPAPDWFLDVVEQLVGCRIEDGSPVDLPPRLWSEILAPHAKEMQDSASKPFSDFVTRRFGEGS